MIGVPVRCPQCNQHTFVIRPGDKFFCTNSTCTHAGRLSTDLTTPANLSMQRYYLMELEQLACRVLSLDYFELRRDGTLRHVTNEPVCGRVCGWAYSQACC